MSRRRGPAGGRGFRRLQRHCCEAQDKPSSARDTHLIRSEPHLDNRSSPLNSGGFLAESMVPCGRPGSGQARSHASEISSIKTDDGREVLGTASLCSLYSQNSSLRGLMSKLAIVGTKKEDPVSYLQFPRQARWQTTYGSQKPFLMKGLDNIDVSSDGSGLLVENTPPVLCFTALISLTNCEVHHPPEAMAHYHSHYHCSGFALPDDVTRFPEHPTTMSSSNNTSGKPPLALQIHITDHETHDFLQLFINVTTNTARRNQYQRPRAGNSHGEVEGTSSSASPPCDFQTLTEHHLTSPLPPPPTTLSSTAPTLPSPQHHLHHHYHHLTPSPSTTTHLCTYYHHPLPSPAQRFILFNTSHLSLHHHRHCSLIPRPLCTQFYRRQHHPPTLPPSQCSQQLFVKRKKIHGFVVNHHRLHEPYHFTGVLQGHQYRATRSPRFPPSPETTQGTGGKKVKRNHY
ncbi:hypothetical protein O3P69_000959 [Scylla paramamosain]|uniref:Uncharacterized protein n=1 Tax=Scylla paramamosain TaxID=85552 RepID=A0AAW0UV64_SCYPA